MIHALPRIAGTIAGRPPTVVSLTIRPSNVEPIAEACVIASPTCISPRACSTAIRAESPVPGRRAVEPSRRDDDGVLG